VIPLAGYNINILYHLLVVQFVFIPALIVTRPALIIQTSDDGINFKTVTRLEPPRHGWQDTEEDYTHAIPATTARYFRFVYDKDGSEPVLKIWMLPNGNHL
jgi:hypothetical protein